jgi:hypothetical protein
VSRPPAFSLDGRSVPIPRVMRADLERGCQLGQPYCGNSAVILILKIGLPASSITSICQSGVGCSRSERSRALSANIPAAFFLAASSSGHSEELFV